MTHRRVLSTMAVTLAAAAAPGLGFHSFVPAFGYSITHPDLDR